MKRAQLLSFDRVPARKGAGQHVLKNARFLRDRYEVSLVTLGDAPMPGWRHLPVRLEAQDRSLDRSLDRSMGWLARGRAFHERCLRVVEANPADVYHVRGPWEGLAVPAGEPLLFEANGFASVEAPAHHPALLGMPALREKLRRLEDALLDRATLVLTPSPVTKGYVEDRGLEADRVVVVPNSPSFELAPGAARDEQEEPGPGTPLRLCYWGTLAPWQGVPDLLHAVARLDRPCLLTVLTEEGGDRRRWLEKEAARPELQGKVVVRDAVAPEALGPLLAQQDVAVAPLTACERNLIQGCMPIKLLDAMAAGLPLAAPDLPVVVDVTGESQALYPRYAKDALLERLRALADDPAARRALGRAGRERVAARFSVAAHRDALLAAYARVCPP